MTVDTDLQRHQQTWNGFVRFLQISIAVMVATLVLLAWFLL